MRYRRLDKKKAMNVIEINGLIRYQETGMNHRKCHCLGSGDKHGILGDKK